MLSQNSLDNLVQAVCERQEKINVFAITKIAERIRAIGHVLPSDIQALIRLLHSGDDVRAIEKELSRQTNVQVNEIRRMLKYVARDAYIEAKPFYDASQQPYIPFEKNKNLQNVLKAQMEVTLGEYVNLSRNVAFMLRDANNNLVPTPLHEYYTKVTDTAIQAVQSGTVDYNTAMRRTIKDLGTQGMRVVYSPESGRQYTQRLDTAVRRNILDGVRAVNQAVQNEVGKQFHADGVELSVHAYPAPDHAPVQGHQFTLMNYEKMNNGESFQDIQGRHYEAFDRAIGTLNCRHFCYNIIIGEAKQNYTDEQLQNIISRNDKGYTDSSGKHYTMYQCTQMQRDLETKLRYAKEAQMAALSSGDRELAEWYQGKINRLSNDYRAFSKACGLNPHLNKASVSGYKSIKVSS